MRSRWVAAALSAALSATVAGAAMAVAQEPEEPEGVTKAREQVDSLRRQLETLREAKFRADVPVRHESAEVFRKSMVDDMDKDFPETKARPCSRALGRLGLVPVGYDIRKGILDASAESTLAFYDTEKKFFGIVRPDELTGVEGKATVIHELQHALQDQRFDLDHYDKALRGENDDDAALSRTFVVEGEANYVEVRWQHRNHLDELPAKLAELDAETTRERKEIAAKKAKGEALEKSEELPLYYWRSMWEPYTKGALLVASVHAKGGWKAVDELFTRPPLGTSEVLHPAKLTGQRETPVVISLPDLGAELGQGWKKSFESTLGELGAQCFLVERKAREDVDGASGCAGDRLLAFEKDETVTALLWYTTWDTEKDAKDFEEGVAKALEKDPRKGEHALVRKDRDVVLVEGAPEGRAKPLRDAALEKAKKSR